MAMPARPPGRMSLGTLLLGSGPRFARDALGPVLAFYALWKLWGLLPGIAAATLVAVGAFWWQRRQANSGIMPAVGLGIALIQAVVGLASGSASAFFAPGLVANALYGCAFLGSAAIGRPLAGVFAGEMYTFPQRVRTSALFRRIFSVVSLAWGSYMVLRAAVRLAVLSWSSVDLFVVVSILTGIPFTLALMTWSFWYPLRAFQRQPELWQSEESPGPA
jgi:intracellular septation protein A